MNKHLARMIETGRIPHSLLFCGPEEADKKKEALEFAKALLNRADHPDLFIFQPEGKTGMHGIETIRSFSEKVYLAPFSGKRKVFIIEEADRMLPTSANALLKTLEEPSSDSVIILISTHPERLLPTILSRCQKVVLQGTAQDHKPDPLKALLLESFGEGSYRHYDRIVDLSDILSSQLEEQLKAKEEELRHTMNDQLTALQKEALNKEIEGQIAFYKAAKVKELFLAVLAWRRDLHLAHAGGVNHLLMNPLYEELLMQNSRKESLPSLEKTQEAVSKALLSLERSTSPKICIENFLLSIAVHL